MTVLVSPVRVVRVELGVQVGLEDVGVVEDTDEAEKVEEKVATMERGRGRVGKVWITDVLFLPEAIPLKKTHTSL